MERTLSGMMGKGSISHNTRTFSAKNVDKERSYENVRFCHEDITVMYHKLFDEALERYNGKQKRNDRKIGDYYEKIRRGKQEKLFHEAVFQIGNRDDMNAKSENGQLAKEILTEFMEDFQRRNPNLYVFSAHLHMDEETPHVHVDFVSFIRDSKRGMDTRVSLKGALAAQGFQGGTRGATEWNQWIESEKEALAVVMERHSVRWLQKGTHNKHLSVLDFEKQERAKEVAELDSRIEQTMQTLETATQMVDWQLARAEELSDSNSLLQSENEDLKERKELLQSGNRKLEKEQQKIQKEIEVLADSREKLERNVRSYDEDEKWQLPEAGLIQTAKAYRDRSALPLVNKLKELVKSLTIKCIGLAEQVRKLTEKVEKQRADIEWYKGKMKQQNETVEFLQDKVADLERVKRCAGADRVQAMIDSMKEAERLEREQKCRQTLGNRRMSR